MPTTNSIRPVSSEWGRPKKGLDEIPPDADAAELHALLEANWPAITKGTVAKLARSEAAWLQQLATHPKADAALREAMAERLPELRTTRASAGFPGWLDQLERGGRASPIVNTRPGGGNWVGVQGGAVSPNKSSGLGELRPTGDAIPLSDAMKAVVKSADEGLSLEVMNRAFNPVREAGPFTRPGEMFQGKALIPVRDMVAGALKSAGVEGAAAFQPLLAAVASEAVLRTPAHQFDLGGEVGNRVVFYGGARGHADIDQLVHAANAQHLRLAKVMTHVNAEGQGGSIAAIVEDGVGGTTHTGGFSAGYSNGEKVSQRSDWPADYGSLDDSHRTYNAHLVAIDYQAGTEKVIPEAHLAAYKSNADMWDAISGMVVPFASGDRNPDYTNYKFNPLEVKDQASMKAVASSLAELDRDRMLDQHGAFYCAEGQFSVANLGPNVLIKRSSHGETPLGKLVDAFQSAPGVDREHPERGWQHLRDTGHISGEQYRALESTQRLAVYLEFQAEDVPSWQAYGPRQEDGLIAEPMTIATMAWGLLRNYLPREGIAATVAQELGQAAAKDRGAHRALAALLSQAAGGPVAPDSAAGRAALGQLSMKLASGLLLQVLSSPEFKDTLLKKAGFHEITNDGDKQKVLDLYGQFLAVLQDPSLATDQKKMDEAVMKLDKAFGSLEVERRTYVPVTGEYIGKQKGLMRYFAPQCFVFAAQHPELFQSNALRYLATAMHADQAAR